MATVGFLNDNENIAYPFVREARERLPRSAIVDAGFLMGPQSGFVSEVHRIWLNEVVRSAEGFHFLFRCNAPGLEGWQLDFFRPLGAERFASEHADATYVPLTSLVSLSASASSLLSSLSSLSATSSTACEIDEFIWSGFLITGRQDDLEAFLAEGEALDGSDGEILVEPALIRNLGGSYVRSINLANVDRTRVDAPEGCRPSCWDFPVGGVIVAKQCLTGEIYFKEGYNSSIRQNNNEKSLTFSAAVGGGAGEPCEPVPLFDGEIPPPGSDLLEGGPRCDDVIRSINGAGGRIVQVLGGPGATVTSDPENSRLIVNVDFHNLAICAATDVEVEPPPDYEPAPPSEDPCDCGPAL